MEDDWNDENFDTYLFFAYKSSSPKWSELVEKISIEDPSSESKEFTYEELTTTNKIASFVLFFHKEEELFALTGGLGNHLVDNYKDRRFGFNVISRLMQKYEIELQSTEIRQFTGSIYAQTKFFRDPIGLFEQEEFGNIVSKVMTQIGPEKLSEEFGLDDVDKNVRCSAKSSFQLRKTLSLDEFVTFISKLFDLMKEDKQFTLNNVELIQPRGTRNKQLIEELEQALFEEIKEYYQGDKNFLDLEICHQDFDKFVNASHYEIYRKGESKSVGEREDVNVESFEELNDLAKLIDVYDEIKRNGRELTLTESLKGLRIKSLSSDRDILTEGRLPDHINGLITYNDESYVWMDGSWYRIEATYFEDLEDRASDHLSNSFSPFAELFEEDITWDENQDENDFLVENFSNSNDLIVLDQILFENMEICDLIKINENSTMFFHFKKGFDKDWRILSEQILRSTDLIQRFKNQESSSIFNDFYNQIVTAEYQTQYKEKTQTKVHSLGEEDFVRTFSDRVLKVVACFVDTAEPERDLTDELQSFDSSYAKISLVNLLEEFSERFQELELEVTQIPQA